MNKFVSVIGPWVCCVWYQIRVLAKAMSSAKPTVNLTPCHIKHIARWFWNNRYGMITDSTKETRQQKHLGRRGRRIGKIWKRDGKQYLEGLHEIGGFGTLHQLKIGPTMEIARGLIIQSTIEWPWSQNKSFQKKYCSIISFNNWKIYPNK